MPLKKLFLEQICVTIFCEAEYKTFFNPSILCIRVPNKFIHGLLLHLTTKF